MEPLGRRLWIQRKLQGRTQGWLAACAGVPRSQVARVEAGHDARLSTLLRLAEALGLALVLQRSEMSDISDITLAGKSPGGVEQGEVELI
jgi:predicted transcriptional regulator